MAVRPNSTRKEALQSINSTLIWAFATYGFPRGAYTGTRPNSTRKESKQSVNATILWAWAK